MSNQENTKKILIVVRYIDENGEKGGVSNYYRKLIPYFGNNIEIYKIDYPPGALLRVIGDFFVFAHKLLFHHYDVVLLNPSLWKKSFWRAGVYSVIAKRFFHKKVYIFWRGWDREYEKKHERNLFYFKYFYFKSDGMFVLASQFKDKLIEWGYNNNIKLLTTTTEDAFCDVERVYRNKCIFNILFLSRVEIEKGIFLTLDVYKLLKDAGLPTRLTVAGDGGALINAKAYVKDKKIKDVTFLGFVNGERKIGVFKEADIFLFTSFTEGMPNAILEAMSFGLPIVTSSVGGIPEICKNNESGFVIASFDPQDYVEPIVKLVSDPSLIQEYGQYNREYAREHFCASKVAKNLIELLN